jgi:hypothetical protein
MFPYPQKTTMDLNLPKPLVIYVQCQQQIVDKAKLSHGVTQNSGNRYYEVNRKCHRFHSVFDNLIGEKEKRALSKINYFVKHICESLIFTNVLFTH